MDLVLFIAIAIYVASLVITYFRGTFAKQLKIYIIVIGVWILAFVIKLILSKLLDLDKVGIVMAALLVSLDKFWILYVGPLVCIISSILKK